MSLMHMCHGRSLAAHPPTLWLLPLLWLLGLWPAPGCPYLWLMGIGIFADLVAEPNWLPVAKAKPLLGWPPISSVKDGQQREKAKSAGGGVGACICVCMYGCIYAYIHSHIYIYIYCYVGAYLDMYAHMQNIYRCQCLAARV